MKNIPCDYVVLALGVKQNTLPDSIKAVCPRVIKVGDAAQVGRLANATHTAYRAAMELK